MAYLQTLEEYPDGVVPPQHFNDDIPTQEQEEKENE